jgi:squalene-hopene/tetraprenyl-beta-curcumene cyclase
MTTNRAAVQETLQRLSQRLLAARTPSGHWEGRLSSSALSTATAVAALAVAGSEAYAERIEQGLDWLAGNQNSDGGWGDTTLSLSNISTTALGWAAFSIAGGEASDARQRAEAWLRQAAGSLEPARLAAAIARRYGEDRTFSVPILTVLALARRLEWSHVPQLPFELAAFPPVWFQWLRLPVVSYALPALIAIGQIRHHHHPTSNPLLGFFRRLAAPRALSLLRDIQPSSGGYLEAVPLTSFVVMSLVGAGRADHPVARQGIQFLLRSVRPDGSWPIDTNLATWVTTLSVNALAPTGVLSTEDRRAISDWLLAQQYREEHPYTQAAPGGWAWTDLPGGVPDADDTAGALLALKNLEVPDQRVREAACAGVRWLLGLQNRDGGMPTFCRGWGKLPFDRSGSDLTAHALLVWSAWRDKLPGDLGAGVAGAVRRALGYLEAGRRPDGAWIPLWFGNECAPDQANPVFGTARVLVALRQLPEASHLTGPAVRWLLSAQNPDGGWGGDRGLPSSLEETGLALAALGDDPAAREAVSRGLDWLVTRTDGGRQTPASPIGFYFANLWYYEELYPLIFAVGGMAAASDATW